MILSIRVIPRARKSSIDGRRGDALLVRLAAPPVDGAANSALVAFLAETIGIPRRNVALVGGEKSRDKRVRIDGLTDADVQARLSAILKSRG